MTDTTKVLANLNENVLYKISMSSIELFHSNFWEWMFSKYKESVQYFFEDIVEFDNLYNLNIKREYKHLDISIEDGSFFYIIENKIKSLPDQKQLTTYAKKKIGKKTFKKGIIASIIKIDFSTTNSNSSQWVYLDYKDISERIRKFRNDYIKNNETYDAFDFNLIEKYNKMIQDLYEIVQSEFIENNKYQLSTKLKDIGFDAVYKKLLGSMLKNMFLSHNGMQKFKPYFYKEGIYYSINRSNLTFSIYLQLKEKEKSIGIQIEQHDYRWFIVKDYNPKQIVHSKKHKDDIARIFFNEQKTQFRKWLNKDSYNRYVTESYTFVYQKQASVENNSSYELLINRVIDDLNILLEEGYLESFKN